MMMKNRDFDVYRAEVAGEANGITLEIGFGSGLNLPYYKNIDKLYALDPSRELFDMAAKEIERISFPLERLVASAENIPLSDSSIDCVVSTWTMCSIPCPEVALREIFRVLKPGGKFSFIEHGKSPSAYVYMMQNFFTPISKRIAGGCHMNRDIERYIIDAGFEIQKIQKFTQRLRPLGFMYKGVAIAKK